MDSEVELNISTATVTPAALGKIPGEPHADACWYAAYTCARHEKVVAQQLGERCIPHFLPLYTSARRWKDRRKQIELPLFPGYVFVRVSGHEQLRVLQLPSVVRFVSFNGRPAALPEADIDALRNGFAHRVLMESHPYLRVGRRVRVVAGPLTGAQGVLLRKKDSFRIVMSIDALMRSVAVEIDAADVTAVD